MSEESLSGRRILVTAGATGIGAAISEHLAREGAHVIINYRSRRSEAEQLRQRLLQDQLNVSLAPFDVTVPEEVNAQLRAIAEGGGIYGLVHAASAPINEHHFRKTPWDDFARHWEVAVKGTFLLLQGAIELKTPSVLRSVVLVSSSVTLGAPPAQSSAYTTAKYGLLGLARSVASELASRGVRINCVSPGFANTALTAHVDERVQELIAKSIPMKRLTLPSDVAGTVAFLMSDSAIYITGVNLPIAGGAVM